MVATSRLLALDDHNPIGVTGAFEGIITTGGAYNVLNHNATRQIDDIVVPGAIGKYGLKMSRYYNSRRESGWSLMGPGWTYEYLWSWDSFYGKAEYPNGNVWESTCAGNPLGVSDWPGQLNGDPTFRLADGGTVVFGAVVVNGTIYHSVATQIIDPYGQPTTITYYANTFQIYRVAEPGGRYLQFNYSPVNGVPMLTEVDAYDGRGNRIDYVVYHYTSQPTGGTVVTSAMCLTSVDYSDGQHASYTYRTDNVPEHQDPCPCSIRTLPLVSGCDDVRYHGPMRRIAYEYPDQGAHGAILRERYWDGVPGHEPNGQAVSRIDPPAPSPLIQEVNFDTTYTEYRGDGPTRTFTYTPLHVHRPGDDSCPTSSPVPQQFLTDYTDFRRNNTHLGYDPNWYVNSVRDANLHTTSYVRGSPPPDGIGEVLTITHPGGAHIDYTYDDHGHYVHSISNERQKVTTYTRDGSYRVTRIDYPADANTLASYEEFLQYNNFGQFTVHHLKNGAYERFVYDGRGLLTDKYNPQSSIPGGNDPHTHYDYYTSRSWTDRVQKMTLPANISGFSASETYEYDRALSGGVTDLNGAAVAGRGLVTKITHKDGTYQRFKYDAYGNKVWADNELRKITQYAYDDYNRLLSVTNPLSKTTRYDYAPTQGNSTQAQQHTNNSPWWVTMPSTILTNNVYDENWRKTSTTPANGVLNPTTFAYDNVGNLTDVTDPRGKITHNVYDNRDRKTQTTEAYTTPIAATTVWHYDTASNINQIDRPDGIHETKGYDALNRMKWHTVPRQVPGSSPTPAPINLTTHIYYNPSGTIEHVTDERTKPTAFQYNASDEKTTMTYPLLPGQQQADTQSWVWDNAHNLASRTTVHGETQSFSYDTLNRKTDMRWSNTVDSAHYTYYADSRLNIASNPNSSVTRHYDDAGHLDWEQQTVTGLGSTKTVNYPSYDNDGRLTNINVGGASYDYTYSYDAAGRFEKIQLTGGSLLFQYAYDAASNETHRYAYLPNSTTIDQGYGTRDSLNRMPSRLVKRKGTTFSTEAYTYDHMNRVKEVNGGGSADSFNFYWDGELMSATYGGGPHFPFTEGQEPDLDTTDNIDPNAGYQPAEKEDPEPTPPPDDYSDPPVGGLIPEDLPTGHSVGYYFDRAGNRQQLTDTANPTITYVQNNINQYRSASGCSITNGLEHEVNSFQGLYDTHPVNYYYINDEHLKQVSDGTYNRYFFYDALGRCVKRSPTVTDTANTTYYIYDGEKPIVEYGSSGIVGRNVYGKGIDEILMRTDPNANGGNPIYYAQDHEGSVTHLLDGRSSPATQTGNVIEQYHYDAFGAPTFYDANTNQINSTAYNNRFLFTGREYAATYRGNYVPAFRFYEYRARAYHPDLGRFMSEDPKGFDAGDYNLFRYCHNDPIDSIDAMGLSDVALISGPNHGNSVIEMNDRAYNFIMALYQRQFSSGISAGMAGYSAYQGWSAGSGQSSAGLTMGHISQTGSNMNTYSLRPQYSIGDLSGARGYSYVWDENDRYSGQCLTTVQHLTGTPSSTTPLLRGDPVGSNTRQGTAIATGFELQNGRWVYPSKPASQSDNHAAIYVAPIGHGRMQTLEAWARAPIHLEPRPMSNWYELKSVAPSSRTSTSQLRPWDGPIPW
jgi:RHS repeat-associated protein